MINWMACQLPRMKNQRQTNPKPLVRCHYFLSLRSLKWISLIAIITEQLMRTLEKAGGSDPQVMHHAIHSIHQSNSLFLFWNVTIKSFCVFRLCLCACKPLTTLLIASKAARKTDTPILRTFQQSFHRYFSTNNKVIIATSTPITDSKSIVAKRENTTVAAWRCYAELEGTYCLGGWW